MKTHKEKVCGYGDWGYLTESRRREEAGLRTRRVWADMRAFDGYVSHQLFIDQNDLKHLIALGNWQSLADADAVLTKYKDSETIRQLLPLLARPRERWVTCEDQQ